MFSRVLVEAPNARRARLELEKDLGPGQGLAIVFLEPGCCFFRVNDPRISIGASVDFGSDDFRRELGFPNTEIAATALTVRVRRCSLSAA